VCIWQEYLKFIVISSGPRKETWTNGHNSEIVDSVCDTVLRPDPGHHKSLVYPSSSALVAQNLDAAVMVTVDDTVSY
jgi:hypothetical protein